MLITQVQRQLSSNKTTHDFDFNHPVKAIVTSDDCPGDAGNALSTPLKVQYNGTEIGEPKEITPHFNQIPSYYHTFNSNTRGAPTSSCPMDLTFQSITPPVR